MGFWKSVTPEERRLLSSLGLSRNYPHGAIICSEGEAATHLFIILHGWVKVLSVTDNGQTIVLALRGDGDIVGDTAGATAGRRTATIEAIGVVHALIVDYDRFSSFLDTHSSASQAYRRMMALRWSNTDEKWRQRAVTSGPQRFAGLLLDLASQYGSQADSVVEMALPLSQEELASLAGTSRATVARALGDWRRRGWLRTGQRRITLIDLAALRRAAGPAG